MRSTLISKFHYHAGRSSCKLQNIYSSWILDKVNKQACPELLQHHLSRTTGDNFIFPKVLPDQGSGTQPTQPPTFETAENISILYIIMECNLQVRKCATIF